MKLQINNFRSFKSQKFDFNRINILIGENSGGKSSLIKFLLALKQSIETPSISNLILSGMHIDLGNYKEVIYNHIEKNNIEFSFTFKEELKNMYYYFYEKIFFNSTNYNNSIIKKALNRNTHINFIINKDLANHEAIKMNFSNAYLGTLDISFNKNEVINNNFINFNDTCTLQYKSKKRNKVFILKNVEYEKKGFLSLIESMSLRKECEQFGELAEQIFYELSVFLFSQNVIENELSKIIYLNPLNTSPKRIYLNKDVQNIYIKHNLNKFNNQIINNQVPKNILNKFNFLIQEYGIAQKIDIVQSRKLPVSEIRVKIKELYNNITDVGYGVSVLAP